MANHKNKSQSLQKGLDNFWRMANSIPKTEIAYAKHAIDLIPLFNFITDEDKQFTNLLNDTKFIAMGIIDEEVSLRCYMSSRTLTFSNDDSSDEPCFALHEMNHPVVWIFDSILSKHRLLTYDEAVHQIEQKMLTIKHKFPPNVRDGKIIFDFESFSVNPLWRCPVVVRYRTKQGIHGTKTMAILYNPYTGETRPPRYI